MGNGLADLLGGGQTLDDVGNTLAAAYGWAKEWQVLLAGLLVLLAALIVASALRRKAPAPVTQTSSPADERLDMRLAPRPLSRQDASGELIGELEQLRSLIRSALSAFTLTAEKENSPVQFLCQRVARVRPDRYTLPAGAPKSQQDLYAALLEQQETLRQQLKRDAQPIEITGTLVHLNTSARSLVAALAPQAVSRRQAGSELR